QQPELVAERAPRSLLPLRHACHPERGADGSGEQAAGLALLQGRLVWRLAGAVEVLAADHADRRLRKLAAHLWNVVRARKPERFREQRVPGPAGDRLSMLRPDRGPAAALCIVVERGQAVAHEWEPMNAPPLRSAR